MQSCIICNHKRLNILFNYKTNSSVTSDNKIINGAFILYQCKNCLHLQKQLDDNYIQNTHKIYNAYESYYLNCGQEEEKIQSDKSVTRSKVLLNNISNIISNHGRILDLGTGTGVFLEAFSQKYPWELYGQDVKKTQKDKLEQLQNFKKFFVFQKDKLYDNYFDIISAIHLFEHIVDINLFLKDIKSSLKKEGKLLLQVPNIEENTFDIFTYDHVSHFTKSTIYLALKNHFKYIYFPKNQIPREITVIASNCAINLPIQNTPFYQDIDYTLRVNSILNRLNDIDTQVAIFGTSPPALFCASYLNFNIDFFIDENENKLDKQLYGKSIMHPNNIAKNTKILFPYSKDILVPISKRYPRLEFIPLEDLI